MDYHLGKFVADHARSNSELAGLSAALVSAELAAGHICLGLTRAKKMYAHLGKEAGIRIPAPGEWGKKLAAAGVAGDGISCTPLVLEEGRLYLRRYWLYEQEIAAALKEMSARQQRTLSDEEESLLDLFFPKGSGGGENLQRRAAETVFSGGVAVISGGPGTGKTTTLARLLYVMLNSRPDLRVALAAPTGKAAARMNEAVDQAREKIAEITGTSRRGKNHESVMEVLAGLAGHTIHRLLGYHPHRGGFRYNRENRLPHDLIIVDEASMIDCSLMAALCRAAGDGAVLVLVGDRDQLASVEAGAVMADICDSALEETGFLKGRAVELKESWRFSHRRGIGALANVINRGGDIGDVSSTFKAFGPDEGISLLPATPGEFPAFLSERIIAAYKRVVSAPDPASALKAMNAFRILTPLRHGPAGVESLNRYAENVLKGAGLVRGGRGMYENRPVMVTRNSYSLNLFNGDTGIVRADREGNLRVYFPAPEGEEPRSVMPAMMPQHETLYAMTVHKSQGSEFDHVILLLPPNHSPVVTRELLYTAVTRARELVEIAGPEKVLAEGIAGRVERDSGLAAKLK